MSDKQPTNAAAPGQMPVLLPFKIQRTGVGFSHWPSLRPSQAWLLGLGLLLLAGGAWAQASQAPLAIMDVLLKWYPLLLKGFVFNIGISAIAMALGTAMGLALGLCLVARHPALQRCAWLVTQFFRNVPWLVLLFFMMFLVPFQLRLFGLVIALPDWFKATIGFSLPVMANIAEIVRGAIMSVPATQWEAAESLAFTPRQTMWKIILPQCVRRMTPPWMNLYSLVAMATVEASVVGVTEMLTLTSEVHTAEGGRPELFAPLYGFALVCFFLYCYPIDRFTARLERRFQHH